MAEEKPKIYVWCNGCGHDWHNMLAMAEDGTALGGHVCSSHGFAAHDMGIDPNGWKRDVYAKHYPDGFDVVWIENPRDHSGLAAAYEKNQAQRAEQVPA